jgi:CheY-like chemotaxis protein
MIRILVIDDEPSISDLLCETLTRLGCTVATAANGRQGLQRLETADFDLVVTDMSMPELDGAGFVHHVRRSNRPLTPVIGMSGTPWLFDEADCDAVLPKPFPLQALIDKVGYLTGVRLPVASTH